MLLLRGTQKLRDRMRGPRAESGDESTTRLGDWFATAMFWKPHAVLLVNQRTLLPVFMPLAPAATLQQRIPAAIADALRAQGVDEDFIAAEVAAMQEIRIAPTNDRSTVGVMTEFVFAAEWRGQDQVGDLDVLSFELSSHLLGPLRHRQGSPDRELAALLAAPPLPSNVVELRPGVSTATPIVARAERARPEPKPEWWQVRVALMGTDPPVWRQLLVSPATALAELHEYIQAAFGWWNYHLYEFQAGLHRYGVPDPDWDFGPPVRDAGRYTMNMFLGVGDSMLYTYDFGDNWQHQVTVEKAVAATPERRVPACTDGARACPPEDCGGPWGYLELLAILADPTHEEHAERVEWMADLGGGSFDPEVFHISEFETNLQSLRIAKFDN
ncbi:MAG: plasmid pRiA4b ORF-3 family protein [Ilumatobacteraceae bacterium]